MSYGSPSGLTPQIKSYVRPEEAAEKGVKAVLSPDDIGRHLTSEMFFSVTACPGSPTRSSIPTGSSSSTRG